MPMIPMKQTVIVRRVTGKDAWGRGGKTEEFTYKCRVDEGGKLVRRTSSQGGPSAISSEEVVTAATILFDKLIDIRLTDTIIFTDELGATHEYQPLRVDPTRGISGKAIFTEVAV